MNTNEEKERAEFEADCKARGLPFLSRSTEAGYTHQYDNPIYQARWEGWQAGRAALRAESEPVAYVLKDKLRILKMCGSLHVVLHTCVGQLIKPASEYQAFYTAPQTEPKDTGSEN